MAVSKVGNIQSHNDILICPNPLNALYPYSQATNPRKLYLYFGAAANIGNTAIKFTRDFSGNGLHIHLRTRILRAADYHECDGILSTNTTYNNMTILHKSTAFEGVEVLEEYMDSSNNLYLVFNCTSYMYMEAEIELINGYWGGPIELTSLLNQELIKSMGRNPDMSGYTKLTPTTITV